MLLLQKLLEGLGKCQVFAENCFCSLKKVGRVGLKAIGLRSMQLNPRRFGPKPNLFIQL